MSDENLLLKYALPESTGDGRGLIYDPRGDIWKVSSPTAKRIDLTWFRENCTSSFLQSLKLALLSLNRTLSPGTLVRYLGEGLHPLMMPMTKPCGEIGRGDLEGFWLTLPADRKYRFKSLKTIINALAQHGIPGHSVTEDALDYLRTISPGNNVVGEAARTWDPVKGPLTTDELDAFLRALIAGFVRAEINAETYVLIWLLASFGARTSNLADLKVCDLQILEIEGITKYELHIPRVKQQGGRFRDSFYTRKVVPEFGVLLEVYIQRQKELYSNLSSGEDLPLFVDPRNTDPIRTYHRYSHRLGAWVSETAGRLEVPSLRTSEPLHLNARRFRYTMGTLARASGLDPAGIAALLDHGDTRTQEVYAAVSPEVLEDYTRRLGGHLTPLASAYLGRIGEPGEITDPQQMVFRAVFRKGCAEPSVGSCEASRKCGGRKPYACYLCPLFVASMEGDHEGALLDVLEERVRFDEHAGDGLRYLTTDSVVQTIRKVIAMVEVRLKEMGKNLTQIRAEKLALMLERGIIR